VAGCDPLEPFAIGKAMTAVQRMLSAARATDFQSDIVCWDAKLAMANGGVMALPNQNNRHRPLQIFTEFIFALQSLFLRSVLIGKINSVNFPLGSREF
jgi:hypothetical protein